MTQFEYRVVPAPAKGQKAPGARTTEQKFAAAIEARLNEEAGDGWEFLRAEILPSVERQGLTGSRTVYQTLLVFRRPRAENGTSEPARRAMQRLEKSPAAVIPQPEPPLDAPAEQPEATNDPGPERPRD